jgi:heat shock protein HtpX
MWEIIQTNKRKSVILIFMLGSVLAALGAGIGYYFAPTFPEEGVFMGILIAMVIWIVLLIASFAGGEQILLATAGARQVNQDEAPQLYNVVEEMKIASGLPAMPRVYIMDNHVPNAFAVGLKPERAAVAVTTGLISRLNRDELQGVIAHEIGHIANRDTLFMTMAGVTVGAIVILADLFLRGLWYSSMTGGRRKSSSQGGQLGLILMIASIVLAILAPLLAQLLYFSTSRKREYLADASASMFTRYPEGLASALEKISNGQSKKFSKSRTLAPMFIINPMAASGKALGLFSTHPPTEDRIKILRGMVKGSSLWEYESAYRKLHQDKGVIGPVSLKNAKDQSIRAASSDAAKHNTKKSLRDVKDILHKSAGYGLLACACGMKLKIPPKFKHKKVKCPRCGRHHEVPTELLAPAILLGIEQAQKNQQQHKTTH